MNNCTVSVLDSGTSVDPDSGYRKKGTQKYLLRDVPAFFSPAKAARNVYKDGLLQYVKPNPSLLIEDCLGSIELKAGQTVVVKQRGRNVKYTVGDAVPVEGILSSDWNLDLERIKT